MSTTPTGTQYGSVHDVVAHLIGVEEHCMRAVADRDDTASVPPIAHSEVGRSHTIAVRRATGADVADRWFDAAADAAATFDEDNDDRPIELHGLPLTRGLALVLRTFELWAHMEDVCVAGSPRDDSPSTHWCVR